MKKQIFLFILMTLLLAAPEAALAHKSGDMFEDRGWSTYRRPAVPSDHEHARNLMASAPLLVSVREDMFGAARRPPVAWRTDMLRSYRVSPPVGPLFRSWAHQ